MATDSEKEFGKRLHEITEYYTSLDYKQQKTIIRTLAVLTKKPPYYITFELDSIGLAKMAEVISYCNKYSIPYTPERRSNSKVAFCFVDLSARNMALIGRFTLK